jgi:hypothetical protein
MTPQPESFDPQPALALIKSIEADLDRLRGLVQPNKAEFDTKDARNKTTDGKFTRRGVEICYRLFDSGKSRYAVSEAMGISFAAATHRFDAWTKAGGRARQRMPLLEDFRVIKQDQLLDEVFVEFWDGPARQLAFMSRKTLDDVFDPLLHCGPLSRRLTPQIWWTVVEENLSAFERIITAKYERTRSRDERLEITESDIRASGENFAREALRAAGIAAR